MDWGLVGAIVGAVALIGVLIAFLTYRRQFPKRRITVRAEVTPLLSEDPVAAKLNVSISGERINDPHLLRVAIRSDSRADIASRDFDDGAPTTFTITPEPFVLSQTDKSDESIGVTWSSTRGFMYAGRAHIEPQLIRRGAEGEFVVVTDGHPQMELARTLINIPIEFDSKAARPPASLLIATSAMTGGLAVAVIAEFWSERTVWGAYLALTGAVIIAVASTYGIFIMHSERRAERARQQALRSRS